MLDEKGKNNIGLFIMNDGEFQLLGELTECNSLGDEKIVNYTTFNPQIREECVFSLNDKPLKIYFRTKNRRIKKKQIKKCPILLIKLELEKCIGLGNCYNKDLKICINDRQINKEGD